MTRETQASKIERAAAERLIANLMLLRSRAPYKAAKHPSGKFGIVDKDLNLFAEAQDLETAKQAALGYNLWIGVYEIPVLGPKCAVLKRARRKGLH